MLQSGSHNYFSIWQNPGKFLTKFYNIPRVILSLTIVNIFKKKIDLSRKIPVTVTKTIFLLDMSLINLWLSCIMVYSLIYICYINLCMAIK